MNQPLTPFTSLDQFLAAVFAGEPDNHDPRLKFAAPSGLGETVGESGGFLIPNGLATDLWSRVYATGRILARCDRQPVTKGDTLKIPSVAERAREDGEQPAGSRFGGAQMYWSNEADAINDTKLQFDLLTLKLKKLIGMFYATDEMPEDWPALAAALKRIFGLEAAYSIEKAIVAGDGVGKPLGILNAPCLITVPKDNAQAADTLSRANLSNMARRLWGPSHATAVWLMNNDVYGKILDIEEADGVQLFEAGPNGERMLHQMPVELCEYTAPLGDKGDIVLADLGQYILAEKEQNPNLLSSIDVRFIHDETAFKLRYRVDGAPAWKTPLTPDNSATTQSAFVTLEERT